MAVGRPSDGDAPATETVRDRPSTTRLELRAGEPFVRVRIAFENRSRDHRVRFHVPLPRPVAGSRAEGQYAVVERGLELEGGHGEVPLPTFPARGFVHAGGVSVLLDHVTEYEVVDGRELALTLLRSFGLISRNENPYREDPAGPQLGGAGTQLLGRLVGWGSACCRTPATGRRRCPRGRRAVPAAPARGPRLRGDERSRPGRLRAGARDRRATAWC